MGTRPHAESKYLTQFNELGLAESVLRAVEAEGYTIPTPIQAEVIPAVLAGRDVLGTAQTGTGKTAAYVLPLLSRIADERRAPRPKTCTTLILAPTRELANQIVEAIRTYGRKIRPSVALVVGGVRPGPQIRQMAGGVDILVATPGRLEDHMSTGVIRLDGVANIILDEADQMMDMGFMPAIRRILQKVPADPQTILLSATMPRQIRALAQDFLNDPAEIAVAQADRPAERIAQEVVYVDARDKRQRLVELIEDRQVGRAIVFARTKHGAEKLSTYLEKAGIASTAIHGNKNQSQREKALSRFRDGKVAVLVATDVAARGIDVDGITHVINFELPNVPEAYVHRIGRTARAGASGIAISFCDGEERGLLRDIERVIGGTFNDAGELTDTPPAPRRERSGPGKTRKPGGQRGANHRKGGPRPPRGSHDGGDRRESRGGEGRGPARPRRQKISA